MAFVLAGSFVLRRLAGVEQAQMGFTTLVTLVLFLGGVQLVSIGLLGEYLARIYDEVKERPLYIVRRRFPDRPPEAPARRTRADGRSRGANDAAAERISATAASGWRPSAALLTLYYVMALSAASQKSMTFDEMAHLTGGYTYWAFNDYRLHPENGNWPQRLGALPAILGGASFPRLDQPAWTDVERLCDRRPVPVLQRQRCRHRAGARPRCDGAPRRGARRARLRVGQTARVAGRRVGEPPAVRVQSDAARARSARHVGHGRGAVLHGGSGCDVDGCCTGSHQPPSSAQRCWLPARSSRSCPGPILVPSRS